MTITISLNEGQMARLERLAAASGMTVDQLAERTMLELADYPGPAGPALSFEDAAKYVLAKNAELYRRLAQ